MDSVVSKGILSKIEENVSRVIIGKSEVTRLLLAAVAAGGHVLLEDVPGTGKTVLAKALAKSMGCAFDRVQFTPDLLPSDVTGLSFFNQEKAAFTFKEACLYQHPAGRRDKQGDAEDAVKPSGMHGRGAGDGGWGDKGARDTVYRDCHTESCGDNRLFSASGGTA